jgi:L-alanine-DL-glutamate epimerase-like enolase superfamily enzyme
MNATVKSIRILPLAYPEPHDHNRRRHIALARIETSDGMVGWGAAITMFPEASPQKATAPFLNFQWINPVVAEQNS